MDFSVSWSLSNVRRSSKVLKNSRLQHQFFRSQAFSESIISYAHLYSRNLIADVVALEQRLQDIADWEYSMVYIYILLREYCERHDLTRTTKSLKTKLPMHGFFTFEWTLSLFLFLQSSMIRSVRLPNATNQSH
jgi:hypothetical protein